MTTPLPDLSPPVAVGPEGRPAPVALLGASARGDLGRLRLLRATRPVPTRSPTP